MKNKCPHLRSALHNTSTASKEHLAHVKQVAHTHMCDTGIVGVDESRVWWSSTSPCNLLFDVPPCPPSWHVQIERQTCQKTRPWINVFQSVWQLKGDKQVQHVLWPVHFFQDCPAPKPLKEEALIVSTHEDTWAQFRKCYSLLTCKNSLMYSYSLQSEHMSFSNTCADDASKCGQM